MMGDLTPYLPLGIQLGMLAGLVKAAVLFGKISASLDAMHARVRNLEDRFHEMVFSAPVGEQQRNGPGVGPRRGRGGGVGRRDVAAGGAGFGSGVAVLPDPEQCL